MLTNKAYIGLVKHHGEFFPGSFEPIISPDLFEAVQIRLKERARPRKTKVDHNFPFTGLLRCGECGSMITAQWVKGNGGRYRYYRCTKKKGNCSQQYLREDLLVQQLKELLQGITLPDEWLKYMSEKIDEMEKETKVSSGSYIGRIKDNERETQKKLDDLITLYLDGDIPKENYLTKKNDLLRQKVSLAHKMDSARVDRNNRVEPLRKWILDIKKATQLVSSDNFFEIRDYFKKIGSNHKLCDKSVSISFCPPTEFVLKQKLNLNSDEPLSPTARKRADDFSSDVRLCGPERTRTAYPLIANEMLYQMSYGPNLLTQKD